MKYYKFVADTPCCGTENTYYLELEDSITDSELGDIAEEYNQENAESYEYLIFGWCCDPVEDGDMTEEEYEEIMDNYYSDCTCTWEEISKEEYLENTEG